MTWKDHVLPLVYAVAICTAQHYGFSLPGLIAAVSAPATSHARPAH